MIITTTTIIMTTSTRLRPWPPRRKRSPARQAATIRAPAGAARSTKSVVGPEKRCAGREGTRPALRGRSLNLSRNDERSAVLPGHHGSRFLISHNLELHGIEVDRAAEPV